MSRGRPRKGKNRRIRASFTLDPYDHCWLTGESKRMRVSKSELLTRLIHEYQKNNKIRLNQRLGAPYDRIARICEKSGISKLSLFGSVLTDLYEKKSDIDMLVEFENEVPGYLKIQEIEDQFTVLFQKKVDLKTYGELSSYFRDEVRAASEEIYVA